VDTPRASREHAAMAEERGRGAGASLRRLLRARELVTLALLAVVAGGLWLFVEVAEAVTSGGARSLDRMVLLAMRDPTDPSDPLGPRWVEEMGRDFTALGGVAVLTLVTIAVALFLWMARRPRSVALLVVAVGGGEILSLVLKHGFARPRPDLVPHGSLVYTSSFPSGHSMMSAVVYLTLGALLARVLPRRRMKALVIACALGATALTGVSRVYLGVHWPTDVLAGWAMGASWAVACWLVADALDRHRPRGTPPEGSGPGTPDESGA
jgi:undecaprenyl-diphosphatase